MQPDRRYPFKPIEDRAVLHLLAAGEPTGVHSIGAVLGIRGRQVHRWRPTGVTRRQAEDLAARLDRHVYEVWPEMRDDDIASLPVCAADDCDETFERKVGNQRYCTRRCMQRVAMRRYRQRNPQMMATVRQRRRERYANDPELRAAEIAYTAAYSSHPSIREHKRRYSRDYYRRNRDRVLARQRAYDQRRAEQRRQQAEAA